MLVLLVPLLLLLLVLVLLLLVLLLVLLPMPVLLLLPMPVLVQPTNGRCQSLILPRARKANGGAGTALPA